MTSNVVIKGHMRLLLFLKFKYFLFRFMKTLYEFLKSSLKVSKGHFCPFFYSFDSTFPYTIAGITKNFNPMFCENLWLRIGLQMLNLGFE